MSIQRARAVNNQSIVVISAKQNSFAKMMINLNSLE